MVTRRKEFLSLRKVESGRKYERTSSSMKRFLRHSKLSWYSSFATVIIFLQLIHEIIKFEDKFLQSLSYLKSLFNLLTDSLELDWGQIFFGNKLEIYFPLSKAELRLRHISKDFVDLTEVAFFITLQSLFLSCFQIKSSFIVFKRSQISIWTKYYSECCHSNSAWCRFLRYSSSI